MILIIYVQNNTPLETQKMGRWLNPGNERFRQRVENNAFYVDKTGMIGVLNGWLFSDDRYVCLKPDKPAIVMELKWDKSAEGAIDQIKLHRYPNVFGNYKGNVLLCGVNYNKTAEESKKHECLIEDWMV